MGKEFAKIKDAFYKLNFILTREQKWYSALVFFFSIVSAVFEMLGVSILIPMINAFLEPETLADQPYIMPFVSMFHLQDTKQIVLCLCIAIIILYLLKNFLRMGIGQVLIQNFTGIVSADLKCVYETRL